MCVTKINVILAKEKKTISIANRQILLKIWTETHKIDYQRFNMAQKTCSSRLVTGESPTLKVLDSDTSSSHTESQWTNYTLSNRCQNGVMGLINFIPPWKSIYPSNKLFTDRLWYGSLLLGQKQHLNIVDLFPLRKEFFCKLLLSAWIK